MSESLALETQGVKGGKTNKKNAVGCIVAYLRHEQDYIFVDDFIGYGENYCKREQLNIQVVSNGKIIFNGTKQELFKKLTNE